LIKNLEDDLKTKRKEKEQLQKIYEKSQNKTKKIGKLEASISQEEQTRDLLERRFNSTRSFDALKEQESNLLRLLEEKQAIINDDDATQLEKEAAEERIAEINEELARLQTQIAEREDASLSEKGSKKFSKNAALLLRLSFLPRASRLKWLSAR